jgi:hypothetical protein
LENWLSTVTDLGSDTANAAQSGGSEDIKQIARQIATLQESGANPRSAQAMANLAEGISALVKNMRSEQQLIRDWVEAQAGDNKSAREALEKIAVLLERQKKEK